jgi:hypothetical protein
MDVLIACEFSATVREAFAARGHNAWSCDIVPSEIPGQHLLGDALEALHRPWDLVIAHPPCTYLTVCGNRWFRTDYLRLHPERVQLRENAVAFFLAIAHADCPRLAIENPIGIMSSRFRPPDQIVQPYQFGHPVRKATGLWLKNLPPLCPTRLVRPELHYLPNGGSISKWHNIHKGLETAEKRSRFRSRTFPGLAAAMADQWGSL